jgi:hypothetical protein
VPIPQLFAKRKSLKSEGIGMPRVKNKGLHGALGHVEPKLQGEGVHAIERPDKAKRVTKRTKVKALRCLNFSHENKMFVKS